MPIASGYFDSVQEWPLNESPGRRRRNEDGFWPRIEVRVNHPDDYMKGLYSFWHAHILEGRECSEETEGIWPISELRVNRHDGELTRTQYPYDTPEHIHNKELLNLARKARTHHYIRITSTAELIDLLESKDHVQIAIQITPEWLTPETDVITPLEHSPVISTHSIILYDFDRELDLFSFTNSWGEEWGNDGCGRISRQHIDKFMVEAWRADPGTQMRLNSNTITRVMWSCSKSFILGMAIPERTVYGVEITDPDTNERIAWAFLKKRNQYLDIDEFFVWPTHRKKGYAKLLSEMVKTLSQRLGLPLRAWISHCDSDPENRQSLLAAMRLLNLNLHPSPARWASLVGLTSPLNFDLIEPIRPARAAGSRDRLIAEGSWKQRPNDLQTEDGVVQYELLFGTNRKHENGQFTENRDQSLHVGKCVVEVPKWHKYGEVTSHWINRLTGIKDGTLRMTSKEKMNEETFWGFVQKQLAKLPVEKSDSILFIHGYNVDFSEAACRAAQIGVDLNVPGLMTFFSWPSRGKSLDYLTDEASVEASEPYLSEFLFRLAKICGVGRLHVIAHSMGNRSLLRVINRVVSSAEKSVSTKLGTVILAAPDVDAEHFRNLAACYANASDRAVLYASPRDIALKSSSLVHKGDRAGLTPPITIIEGIETIVVPKFNLFDLGHGYFSDAAPVLYDMRDVLWNKMEPSRRARLSSCLSDSSEVYWELKH